MDFMKKRKGQSVLSAIPVLIVGLVIAVIMIFNVGLPVTNTAILSTGANLTGYPGALQVSQQLPIMEVLIIFAAVAAAVMFVLRALG